MKVKAALLTAILLISLPFSAQAQQGMKTEELGRAQRWGQKEASRITHMPTDERIARVPVEHFGSEIRFDPTNLDESNFILTTTLKPTAVSPAAPPEVAQGMQGMFISKKIKKTGTNEFEAEGDMIMNGRKVPMKVPFAASFSRTAAEPTIVLDGNYKILTSQFATGTQMSQYPNEIPLNFHIEATPIP